MGDCIPIIQSHIWQWKVSQIFNFAAHRNSTTRHLCPLLFISHIYTTQKTFHCFLIFHSYQGYCVPHQNKLCLHLYPLIHTETLLRGRLHVSDMKFMPAWKKIMLHACFISGLNSCRHDIQFAHNFIVYDFVKKNFELCCFLF